MVGGGTLIAFEGIDGCGKSTQARLLADALHTESVECELLREPGDTPLGEEIRHLLLRAGPWTPRAETLLYMAARAELYERRIGPALRGGTVVLVDRSSYSTAAYQGVGLEQDARAILELGRTVTGGWWPERVVLLRVTPSEAARRREPGSADRIESRGSDYFERVAAAFDDFAREDPQRFLVLDGTREPQALHEDIRRGLADVL